MPYNIKKDSFYQLDYSAIKDEIIKDSRGKIFDFDFNFEKYLDTWIEILIEIDRESIKFIKNNKRKFMKIYEKHQYFVYPHFFGNNEVLIHFNSGHIYETIVLDKPIPTMFTKKDFLGKDKTFIWNNKDKSFPTKKKEPAIAVTFYHGTNAYLIIDGNNRLRNWVSTKDNIPVVKVDTTVDDTRKVIFSTIFDEFFYLFLFDMHYLAFRKQTDKLNDIDLIKHSYLNTVKIVEF